MDWKTRVALLDAAADDKVEDTIIKGVGMRYEWRHCPPLGVFYTEVDDPNANGVEWRDANGKSRGAYLDETYE